MACCILEGTEGGSGEGRTMAVFYCNTMDRAFGPLMRDYYEADSFQEWLDEDPRRYHNDKLEILLGKFRELEESDR